MQLKVLQTFVGPNIYSRRPGLIAAAEPPALVPMAIAACGDGFSDDFGADAAPGLALNPIEQARLQKRAVEPNEVLSILVESDVDADKLTRGVVRLPDGRLFLHSPIAPSDDLAREVEALGPVAYLVAPNKFHHLFVSPLLNSL